MRNFSKKLSVFTIALMLIIFSGGCKSKIDGEVFVVAKSGEVTRLALAQVYLLPVEEALNVIDENVKRYNSAYDEVLKIKSIDFTDISPQIQEYNGVGCMFDGGVCFGSRVTNYEMRKAIGKKIHSQLMERIEPIRAKMVSIDSFEPNSYFKKNLSNLLGSKNAIKLEVNSDGKFAAEVDISKYVLVAFGGRDPVKEKYLWLIKPKTDSKHLILSNDNIFGVDCDSCIAKTENFYLTASTAIRMAYHYMETGITQDNMDTFLKYVSEI